MASTAEQFSHERFMSLSGTALWDYMPQFYDTTIPSELTGRIIRELDSLDNEHLVAVIEFVATCAWDDFAAVVPRYLAHESQSVRLAASRFLRRLPRATQEVLEAAKCFAASCPEDVTDELAVLASRIQQRSS